MTRDDFENNADVLATAIDEGQGDWNQIMQNVISVGYHFQTNVMNNPPPTPGPAYRISTRKKR